MLLRALLLVLLLAHASPAAKLGNYFSFDAGLNHIGDVETDLQSSVLTASGEFKLDPGFRVGVGYGFILNRLMSLELETGFLYNSIDTRGVAESEAWYGQVPILLNVVFRHDCECRFTPFIGVGGGGVASILDLSAELSDDEEITEADAKFVPALQGLAGLRYRFNDRLSLGIIYKFLWTDAPNFDFRGTDVELDPVMNHTIGAQLSYTF